MKFLFTSLFLLSYSFAGLINGIALTVNGEPVTLYDIDRYAQLQGVSKEKATMELLKQSVTRDLAVKNNVVIDKDTVTAYINGVMKRNKLDRKSFEQNLQIEGLTYKEYEEQIHMQHLQQRLIGMLTYGKISEPTQEDRKNFFNQNSSKFSMPSNIEVVQYSSPNQQSLINKQRSPMFIPKDITQETKTINPKTVNPQLAQILLATKLRTYTKVFPVSATSYTMFYISNIGKVTQAVFEDVEKEVTQQLKSQKRNSFINNIFQDAMRKANINYIMIKPLDL